MWNVQKMRLSGLASGMDTDLMVQNLMRVERLPLDRLYQQRQLLEWKRDDYRNISNSLRRFKDEYMDILKPKTNMLSPNYFKNFKATVTDAQGKESNAVTISTGSGAIEENLEIKVEKLAKAATVSGKSDIEVDILNKNISTVLGEPGLTSLIVNGEEIKVDENTTLKSFMEKVNSNEKAGVYMRYNEISESIEVIGKATGEDITIDKRFMDSLQIGQSFLGEETVEETVKETVKETVEIDGVDYEVARVKGQKAKVTINGKDVERLSNTFTLNGVTYTLNKETEVDNSITVSLKKDIDTGVENVKTMIAEYNTIVELLNGKVGEKYDKNFPPLTQEQREAMDSKDIEKWEEKAKVGLLNRDSLLQGILQDMRRSLSDPVDGVFPIAELRKMGIDTSKDYKDGGKLVITDENKLREALEKDPDAVANIFTKKSDTNYSRTMDRDKRQERYSGQGLLHRLSDIINDNISTSVDNNGRPGLLVAKAGLENTRFVSDHQIYDDMKKINTRMDDLERNLYRKESAYYAKFAAMEKAMQSMQNQAASLLSQLGMG